MSFFIPRGEKSSVRLSFLLEYFKKSSGLLSVFSKIGLEFFSNLSFFGLSIFQIVQIKAWFIDLFVDNTPLNVFASNLQSKSGATVVVGVGVGSSEHAHLAS